MSQSIEWPVVEPTIRAGFASCHWCLTETPRYNWWSIDQGRGTDKAFFCTHDCFRKGYTLANPGYGARCKEMERAAGGL
ncbi:hypothetical protein [Mollivirus kamchatka]|nr:hypothetical protein [Mollivirus kamchatka]